MMSRNVSKDFFEIINVADSVRTLYSNEKMNELTVRLDKLSQKYKDCHVFSNLSLREFKFALLGNLMMVLYSTKRDSHKCHIVNFIKSFILKSFVTNDLNHFFIYYNTLFSLIYSSKEPQSEELKLAVLECSTEYLKCIDNEKYAVLYQESNCAKFSMGVLMAIKIAREEKSIQLRRAALDFLLTAMKFDDFSPTDRHVSRAVGSLFVKYLPGLIVRLQEIISMSSTQPHDITIKALQCWGRLMTTVMYDSEEEEKLSDVEHMQKWMNLSKGATSKEPKVFDPKTVLQDTTLGRTDKWLQAAAQTIAPVILSILKDGKNPTLHHKVRCELAVQVSLVLETCLMNLKIVLNSMIEVLNSACEDEDPKVQKSAISAIERFKARCNSKNSEVFVNILEENLFSIINRISASQQDRDLLNLMQALCGVLKLLLCSDRLKEMITFTPSLNRLIGRVLLALKLNMNKEIRAQDFAVTEYICNEDARGEWKQFSLSDDPKVINKLMEVCRLLGGSGEFETILDYLMVRLNEDHCLRNNILLFINTAIAGCSCVPSHLAEEVISFYLDFSNLYPDLEEDGDFVKLDRNITTIALTMEGMGALASAIGKRFQDYLLRSLYHVVERLGSSYRIIRKCAIVAASRISKAVGSGGDVASLIQSNLDYLTYHVTVKLKRNHPGVFDVVTVLVNNSAFEAVENLEEIIINVTKSFSENFSSPRTLPYLRLFHTFAACVSKWKRKMEVKDKDAAPKSGSIVEELVLFVEEKEKPVEEESEEEVKEPDVEEETTRNEEKLSKHVELIISIAEISLNYLPSSDPVIKLITLEILNHSVLVLADHENQLLPLVHKIWSPFVGHFESTFDPLIVNRNFTLLCTLSSTAKDFIRRRTLKGVLPFLRDFLRKSIEESAAGKRVYEFTQKYKLQRELLEKLGELAVDLQLNERELEAITDCVVPYLNRKQPKTLRENCRKLLKSWRDHDPYLVCFRLYPLASKPEYREDALHVLKHILPDVTETSCQSDFNTSALS